MWTPNYIPAWIQHVTPNIQWHGDPADNTVYLTFDDGPTPGVTDVLLNILDRHSVKATFFCLGGQVENNKQLYDQVLQENHRVGNHSYSHYNGWKTKQLPYVSDIKLANQFIQSDLFRPPYGRITPRQLRHLTSLYRIVMYSVLARDYESKSSPQMCIDNVLRHTVAGSIILMHDSEKAKSNLLQSIEPIIIGLKEKGFTFSTL